MTTHKYPYSIANGWFYTTLSTACTLFCAYVIFSYCLTGDYAWLLFALPLAFLFMTIWIVAKKLIPALKGTIALEITSSEIVSYIEDVTIEWHDIKSIDYDFGTSAGLIIRFRNTTDYGSSMHINLQYVKGDDREIYATVMQYYNLK